MNTFAESDVERAAIDWLSTQGWSTAHGPNIAPDAENSERVNYGSNSPYSPNPAIGMDFAHWLSQ